MKISEIMSTLRELEAAPRKSLGQNFLHDANLASWIVGKLDLGPTDHVIEIGPGLGALTVELERLGVSATLLEKDRAFAQFLRNRYNNGRMEVVEGDALEYDTRLDFLRPPVKVVGNLPYYMSSALLFHFIADPCPFERMVFTVQKEMADRLCALPGNRDYGSLSLMVQSRWRLSRLKTLPPSVFLPQPQVDSAVILLDRRRPGELETFDPAKFAELVKIGFSERRKQVKKLLAPMTSSGLVEDLLRELHLSETVRAEAISLEQWIRIVNSLAPKKVNGTDLNELIQVVDRENRPLPAKNRATVHQEKLYHQSVHIFIRNQRGELLLQRRSHRKDKFPGRWDSGAAGHVDANESYERAATREVDEELGIRIALERVGSLPASGLTGFEFVEIYEGTYDGTLTVNESEIETVGWFEIPMIDRWIAQRPADFSDGFLECYRLVGPRFKRQSLPN
jgi:16S rRNA (adenine1518-N6/adenine1519-N6)-dimethyltransferase